MTVLDTGIIQHKTIVVLVDSYKTACKEVDQAYDLLIKAQNRMNAAYGDGYRFECLPRFGIHTMEADSTKAKLRKSAWQVILNRLEIEKIMSIKDLAIFRKSFEDDKTIPEIEISTVMDILNGLVGNAPDYAKRLVLEVYDILMPGTKDTTYKTNTKNARRALGKKVILERIVSATYDCRGYRANYSSWASDRITAIDKVFHTLDGKGIPEGYRCPLMDAINTTGADGRGQTEYFKFNCYRNGNLHLEFKRMDLVSKLNQVAGDRTRIADGGIA